MGLQVAGVPHKQGGAAAAMAYLAGEQMPQGSRQAATTARSFERAGSHDRPAARGVRAACGSTRRARAKLSDQADTPGRAFRARRRHDIVARLLAQQLAKASGKQSSPTTAAARAAAGFEYSTWYGLLAPAGVRADIVGKPRGCETGARARRHQAEVRNTGRRAAVDTPPEFAAY